MDGWIVLMKAGEETGRKLCPALCLCNHCCIGAIWSRPPVNIAAQHNEGERHKFYSLASKKSVFGEKKINLSAGDDSVNRSPWKTFQVSKSILKSVSFIPSAALMTSCRYHHKRALDAISVTRLLMAVEEKTSQVSEGRHGEGLRRRCHL